MTTDTRRFRDIINEICGHLPCNFGVVLFMENGAAFVELEYPDGKRELIESEDDELCEQLERALGKAYLLTGMQIRS